MPGLNLTRDEAIERAGIIKRVHTYRVDLDLRTDKDVFSSIVEIRFDAEPGASTFIDAITSQVNSIELNGERLDPALADGERITLPNLAAQNVLKIDAEMFYTNTGEGLHRLWTRQTVKFICTHSSRFRILAVFSLYLSSQI